MWPLRKQMRKPFVTTRSRVYNKILQRNEHVCVCIRKRNFSTKTKGASSSTFLLPKLMNIFCCFYCMCFAPSKHIFVWYWFCCLWTQKCVGGKLLNWFYVLQWMWYRGCTNVLPRGKLFLLYTIRWYTKRGKVALQNNHQFLSRKIVININLILLCLFMFH